MEAIESWIFICCVKACPQDKKTGLPATLPPGVSYGCLLGTRGPGINGFRL